MDKLRENGFALYAIYTDIGLDDGFSLMQKYLGHKPDMYSNKTTLNFEFAPQKALVNLKTMELMALESYSAGGFKTFSVEDAIELCSKL